MADPVRWGILSTARIGRNRVIPAIQQSRNGVVAAVASRDLARARAFADDLGIPTAYGSYEELIADPNIDAIYNPLPNSEHTYWSIRCAEAGKPCLCEKPLASDAADAQTMVDAFAARGVLFAEAFMYRFHPQTEQVKALVESGVLGELLVVSATFTFIIREATNIRLNHALAGGGLMDVGCYCLNVMRLMTGEEPDAAHAFARIGADSGVDEALAGVLRFPSGVLGHFDCGVRAQHNHSYELRGTKGRIFVEQGFVMPADSATRIRVWENKAYGQDDYREIAVPPANHYTLMAEDFADALLTARPPRYLPTDGVANMRVIDQLKATL
jgi:predicted dehydrogenase